MVGDVRAFFYPGLHRRISSIAMKGTLSGPGERLEFVRQAKRSGRISPRTKRLIIHVMLRYKETTSQGFLYSNATCLPSLASPFGKCYSFPILWHHVRVQDLLSGSH